MSSRGPQEDRWRRALGVAIRETRLRQELTQEQLAVRSGIHATEISHLERGNRNPSFTTMRRLSLGLGVGLSELATRIQEVEAEMEP